MPKLTIRYGSQARELVVIKSTGEVTVRAESGEMVRVHLLEREVEGLRNCGDAIEALAIMAGIVARVLRPN